MSLVTKQDILKPEGQKFGIGDLVRVKPEEDGEGDFDDDGKYDPELDRRAGLYRVLGSAFQLYGEDEAEHELDDDDPDAAAEEREDFAREIQANKEEYSLINVDGSGDRWAWCDESRMEAVPEDAIQGESA